MTALAFSAPEAFERSLLRTVAGAAAGGLLAGLLHPNLVMVLALAGALAALGTRRSAPLLAALGALTGAVQALGSATHPAFYLAAAGGLMGLGLALARWLSDPGSHRTLDAGRWLAVAVAGAASLSMGAWAMAVFDSNGVLDGLPAPVAFAARASLMGFFGALAGAALHLTSSSDPVEALYRRTAPALSGELAKLAHGAFDLYQRAREALAGSPQSAARQHVGRSLEAVTTRVLALASRWHALDVEVGDGAERGVAQRVAEVQKLFAATKDPSARAQLQSAERALTDELTQIRRIRAGRERVLARLHADLATLERTRFSLLALRCTDAHLAASELSQLSENLGALGTEMDGEARAIDEALHATRVSPPAPLDPPAAALEAIAEVASVGDPAPALPIPQRA